MGCGDVWMLGDAAIERIRESDAMNDDALARAEAILRPSLGPRVHTSFPMAPLTTFRIGGPAAIFVEPESEEDLKAVSAAVVGDRCRRSS